VHFNHITGGVWKHKSVNSFTSFPLCKCNTSVKAVIVGLDWCEGF